VYLQRAAERARSGGLPEVEEGHLWQLLERLHILGRTEDAEQIRSALRSLIQNVGHVPLATVHGLQRGAG
jgi:hypothetical protein